MDSTIDTGKSRGKSVTLQITLAFLANFANIAPGMSMGFSAVAIPALKNLDSRQISWVASIASLASPIGCLCSGPIADRFGRRMSIGVVNVTSFVGWLIVALAYYLSYENQYAVLLVGRFLTGLATGLCGNLAAVYMAEVASLELRSVFTTWVSLFYAAGIFIVYLLGMIFKDDWGAVSLIAASCPVVGMLFLRLWIPESPTWLIAKNRLEEAKKNVCRLHGTKTYTDGAREELESLLASGNVKKFPSQKTLPQQFVKKLKLHAKMSFYKPYLVVTLFFIFQQFSGVFVIIFYAIDIVKGANVELDPYVTIVIIALTRLIAMMLLSYFSKNFGRRPLSLISGAGMTICMLTLGSYILGIKQGLISEEQEKLFAVVPVVLLVAYFFISTMGFYPIPFALASEFYPRNIRGTAASISTGTNFIFNFIAVKVYPTMVESMGTHGVFFFYGGTALVGTLWVLFCLPETRGKTLEEIQEYFVPKKSQIDFAKEENV